MRFVSRFLVLALICFPALAVAQPAKDAAKSVKPAPPVPVSANPERTTASFGDWVMRCEGVGTPVKRVCEVAQVFSVQGQAAPIAQIAIGRLEAGGNKQVTLVLPPNVALLIKPQINVAKAGAAAIELLWQRCVPGACLASVSIADSVLAGLSAEAEPGRIAFKDAADREVTLQLSFRGLAPALDALAKE